MKIKDKKLPTTPCKNNCLVLAYSENPADFPLVRSIFSKLVACTRNYPYTNTLCASLPKMRLKKLLYIFLLILLNSCCDTFCEREKYAKSLIQKVENYKIEFGLYPENLEVFNIKESEDSPAFYEKTSDSTYIIWYGLGFESKVYNSKTKKWKIEG